MQWLLKNGEMLAGKAVCRNLIKRAFYFQQQKRANRKRKLRESKSSKMTGAKAPGFPGPGVSIKKQMHLESGSVV